MSQHNLFSALRAAFPSDLGSTAVEATAPDGAPLNYSWDDLDHASARIANLLASLKLPEGSRVAVQVEKSVEAMLLYLATLRAGYVFLPLNTAYQSAEIEYFIGNAEPAVVVCSPGNFGWVSKIAFTLGTQHVFTRPCSAPPMTWPPSCTPAAPRAAARAPCSRTATCCRTRGCSRSIGAGRLPEGLKAVATC
jgi:acyl-CoA synthetase (AMP-forming)/AMP-acid ligase II